MCWSRSGQPHGLPALKECDSCSLSPQEEKVLLSSFSLPSSPVPAPALVRSFSCGFNLAENSFLQSSPLARAQTWFMGDVQEAAGKGGKGRTGSSVLQQHKSAGSALLLRPSRTPQLRKEQFLLVDSGT